MPIYSTSHLRFLTVIILLSVYVYLILNMVDELMVKYIQGYQPPESYVVGLSIFFIASYTFALIARQRNQQRIYPYFTFAIAIYFPLVVFAALVRIQIELKDSIEHYYLFEYCQYGQQTMTCGKAFANTVYSTTIRSLPLVTTVPPLYFFLAKTFIFPVAKTEP